jgi:hypothetical protein
MTPDLEIGLSVVPSSLRVMRRDSGIAGTGAGHVRGTSLDSDAAAWLAAMSQIDVSGLDESGALEAITSLERLKRAASAAQARLSVRVDELARRRPRAEGIPPERLGAGVGAQVALARMESRYRGGRDLGLAKALVFELPIHRAVGPASRRRRGGWRSRESGRSRPGPADR